MMNRFTKKLTGAAVAAMMMLTAFPLTASAAAAVTIVGPHAGNAYGNSSDGGVTANLSATSRTLIIESGANISDAAYGGYANTGNATRNMVIMNGGSAVYVYGGRSENGSATGNIVTINGGTVGTGANTNDGVYGGYVLTDAGGRSGTGNTVTLNGGTVPCVYGGHVRDYNYITGPTGDYFTGNTLNKNSETATVTNIAAHFATVNFGYSGNANINTLGTLPLGAARNPPVKINTQGNDINFSGDIEGPGGIDKQGDGTLTLSGTNTYTGETVVTRGTLEFAAPSALPQGSITVKGGATVINNSGVDITVNERTLLSGEQYTNVPNTGLSDLSFERWSMIIWLAAAVVLWGYVISRRKQLYGKNGA